MKMYTIIENSRLENDKFNAISEYSLATKQTLNDEVSN